MADEPRKEPDAVALRATADTLLNPEQASVLRDAADRLDVLSKLIEDDRGAKRVWKAVSVAALLVLLTGIGHYSRLMLTDSGWNRAERFGQLGDALGPVAALFSALAVGVALWSVRLQSKELALQRQEMKDARAEMREQAEQLRESAKAQRDLARATEDLAEAQRIANSLSEDLIEAQLGSNVATLVAAEAGVRSPVQVVRLERPLADARSRLERYQDVRSTKSIPAPRGSSEPPRGRR